MDSVSSEVKSYAAVALNVPVGGPYHYLVPDLHRAEVALGARVVVPFGKRDAVGYVVGFSDEPGVERARIRDIQKVIDHPPLIDERLLKLAQWMAWYYCCSVGLALEAVLPPAVRSGARARTALRVCRLAPPDALRARANELDRRAPRQAQALRALADRPEEEAAAQDLPAERATLAALAKVGLVALRHEAVEHPEDLAPVARTEPLPPTPEQAAALAKLRAALDARAFRVALLHGVTGSGKTEVYLQALQHCVASGRQGIVLVPEIALTPQTVARFRARFDRVCAIHSGISERERRAMWHRIRRGEVDVIVGTRACIFAPVPRLGLLIVDEEHEPSFKQPKNPRYHARDVGIYRAQQEGALVLLGSATPSLESYYNAKAGKYDLLRLPRRIEGRPLPPVEVHNLAGDFTKAGLPVLSRRLRLALEGALQRGEQAILFMNRRGFSTQISCPRCGFVMRCPSCDVCLTFHREKNLAKCHHCAHVAEPPESCPGCGLYGIKYKGTGTERIEAEIERLFGPGACVRMDSDSMRRMEHYDQALADFRAGKTRILIGTQMVGKGLDFPNVTLVGVVNADTSINMPDFRAAERTFQLLAQVAGRAGRGPKGGRVIIQTFSPDHPCVHDAARHDYEAFARRELQGRRERGYPPFMRLARLLFEGPNAKQVEAQCRQAVEAVRAALGGPAAPTPPAAPGTRFASLLRPVNLSAASVSEAAEAPIARLNGKARWHALVKAPDATRLHQALAGLAAARAPGVRMTIDVDPVSLL